MHSLSIPDAKAKLRTAAPAWTTGACATLLTLSVYAADVLVVTDSHHPIESSADARIIELDRPSRLEAELAADLPPQPDQAAALVRHRLQQDGELQQRLEDAWQGVAESWGLGITKIPAVVVDRRYVVYGEPNVARAVARIQTYRRTQP